MATSKDGVASKVGRYLTSNQNIAGAAMAISGLLATVPTGLAGDFWPLVVGGLYGVGALVVPSRKVKLAVPVTSGAAQAAELREHLDDLRTKITKISGKLPRDVHQVTMTIMEKLRSIIDRGEDLAASPDHLHLVSATITDYLPTSLETYANLPRNYALYRRVDGKRTAHEELLNQLTILDGQMDEMYDAVLHGDAQALTNQGRFLEQKFHSSDLDLDGNRS